MSPEIEWNTNDGTKQDTILHVTSPSRSNRIPNLILLFVIFSIMSIGLYHLVFKPARTVATLMPNGSISSNPFEQMIARESLALAFGNSLTITSTQNLTELLQQTVNIDSFAGWGAPESGPLYKIIETGQLTNDRAWADIIQFRTGRYFRETRFYQLNGRNWLRVPPIDDPDFWGRRLIERTPHFEIHYNEKDTPLLDIVTNQLENEYTYLCNELGSVLTGPPSDPCSAPYHPFTSILLSPEAIDSVASVGTSQLILTLPSPRNSGVYFDTLSADRPDWSHSLENVIYDLLLQIAQNISGMGTQRMGNIKVGSVVDAIAKWKYLQITNSPQEDLIYRPDLLNNKTLTDLDTLLERFSNTTWAGANEEAQLANDQIKSESTALIAFMDQQYGKEAIVKLLHTAGSASSLPDAIQQTGLDYTRFKQDWQNWLRQFASK